MEMMQKVIDWYSTGKTKLKVAVTVFVVIVVLAAIFG